MSCRRGLCTAQQIFIFINIAFAMYSGALLATAARLAWDPSTYTWFRFLLAAQYRVSTAYVLAAGLWLAALVAVAALHLHLHLYAAGVACLAASELAYGAWMASSLLEWWRGSPQAELARRGADVLHDLKRALLAVDKYVDVARPLLEMLEEVEREAPKNVFVVVAFGALALLLQVAAFVTARRLARRAAAGRRAADGPSGRAAERVAIKRGAAGAEEGAARDADADADADSDSDSDSGARPAPPGWRKTANLRMYTILDKIF